MTSTNEDTEATQNNSGNFPELFYHGTVGKFDPHQIGTGDKGRAGVFFTKDPEVANIYAGVSDEGEIHPEEDNWQDVNPNSYVVVVEIDDQGFVRFDDINDWLMDREVHPMDNPAIRDMIFRGDKSEDEIDYISDWDEGIFPEEAPHLDTFWEKHYQVTGELKSNPGGVPIRDTWWGPATDYIIHHGAPGAIYPDSLYPSMGEGVADDISDEFAVYDTNRINVLGGISPRRALMEYKINSKLGETSNQIESALNEDCADDLQELHEAVNIPGGDLTQEQNRLTEARRIIEDCIEKNASGITNESWGRSIQSLGGEELFEELRNDITTQHHDKQLASAYLKKLNLSPLQFNNYLRDSARIRPSILESIESGYITPTSSLSGSINPNKDPRLTEISNAVDQYKQDSIHYDSGVPKGIEYHASKKNPPPHYSQEGRGRLV